MKLQGVTFVVTALVTVAVGVVPFGYALGSAAMSSAAQPMVVDDPRRATFRTKMFAALSADHAAYAQGLIDAIASGRSRDIHGAATLIEARLSPEERSRVVAIGADFHAKALREPPPPPPGGESGERRGPPPLPTYAGAIVMHLGLSHERLEALRPRDLSPGAMPNVGAKQT